MEDPKSRPAHQSLDGRRRAGRPFSSLSSPHLPDLHHCRAGSISGAPWRSFPLPVYWLRPQLVGHAAIRLFISSPHCNYIPPALQSPCWLLAKFPIHFKMLLVTPKSFPGPESFSLANSLCTWCSGLLQPKYQRGTACTPDVTRSLTVEGPAQHLLSLPCTELG